MNAQEIFDTVVTHLRKQGCKSLEAGGARCMYRGFNNTKCAAGCLIPDHLYHFELEGKTWVHEEMRECREYVGEEHTDLIRLLQDVHDKYHPFRWDDHLTEVAANFNLTYTPPVV